MARSQRFPFDAERRRLEASTDTDGAIYRANLKGRLHDDVPNRLLLNPRFTIAGYEEYAPAPAAMFQVARLEDQPRLDLRSLAANGLLQEGKLSWIRLVWTRPKLGLFLAIGLRRGEEPVITLYFEQQGATVRQIIALTPRPGPGRHRYRFIIPGYGLAEVLAYRCHRFAPPSLQRLVYSSQRRSKIEPAAKLEARLLKRAAAKSKPA